MKRDVIRVYLEHDPKRRDCFVAWKNGQFLQTLTDLLSFNLGMRLVMKKFDITVSLHFLFMIDYFSML